MRAIAVDPVNPRRLYAAVAERGLYRSSDGGRTFTRVNKRFGRDMAELAITPDRRLLAGDLRQAMLVSADGGKTWTQVIPKLVLGIAVNPSDPSRVLAVGHGIYLSTDGGRRWSKQFPLVPGAAAVAWAPSELRVAYVGAEDRLLYRSDDGGVTWAPVRR